MVCGSGIAIRNMFYQGSDFARNEISGAVQRSTVHRERLQDFSKCNMPHFAFCCALACMMSHQIATVYRGGESDLVVPGGPQQNF